MAAAETVSLHELCERFRRIYMPAVADAMFHLGIEEQVLPSSLVPKFLPRRLRLLRQQAIGDGAQATENLRVEQRSDIEVSASVELRNPMKNGAKIGHPILVAARVAKPAELEGVLSATSDLAKGLRAALDVTRHD